ncbi:hypothetical protein TTHERM_00464970 (macronuclear) [Tetrahymena thermophila SB210]|uniref:Zinc-finger domain-containing protein n=1 Tax=Tetrahymena thermophila (strain SB210) TaxID=312017 RepID=I7MIU4_TETTS|nr:hypothetical protein TTHERM_00464970 [Tetrahymena thermophila SB210]EAS04749.2 hypothetical protein TTHERM_00464970 [Tetrahymena thermophila SB210]|eukprot:XP_001024994.2 hypothetical protein TTHERM_00464970 [Tetrahymena thermophila SB210]
MGDKGDKDDDKKQQQSEIKNGVEKLIKIDKKHANFEINDTLFNTKVKVRNINSSTSSSILGQNQPENTLRCFWRHINRYYFRKLDTNEMERLSYLDQLFSLKQDTSLQRQKYANHMVYTAIQNVIDKEKFLGDQQQSPEVQKILFKIVKVNCNIQALIYECHFKDKANLKFLDQIIKERDQITPKKSTKKKSINDLQNELQKLKAIEEKLLKQIEQNSDQDSKHSKKKNGHQKKAQNYSDEDSNNSEIDQEDNDNSNNHDNISTASNDEISYYAKHSSRKLDFEQERLVRQLEEINAINKLNLKKLNQKVQAELKEGKQIFFENQNDNSSLVVHDKHSQGKQQQTKQKKKSKKNNEYSSDHTDAGVVDTLPKFGGFQKELGKDPRPKMSEKEISDLHLNYLQQLIFTLEEKQVADSISKITNCKKESKKEFHYEVMFEDALNSQPIYIDEKTLLRFNEYREHSMLRKYNLPIKTLFSSTSHNYVQLTQYVTNRNKPNPYKDQDILDTIKRNSNQHHDQTHHKIINMTRNFDICHHCRQIFELGYLVKCNYRSSVMGMPQSSQSTNDQIFISQIVDYDSNQRRPFLNRKRNNYNSYIKKSNGELVCKRKFCIHCLKQNYDFKHDQSKTDWVCPFCQNYCHCIRCLRNEQINKLKGIYLLYGGDIQYLEQESMLNKYLRPLSEEDRKRKERDDIYNRATNSSMIVFQVQKQTYEKEVEEEKTLQTKLDDLTYVRLDMERVRLVISQVCRREKLKHFQILEEQETFKKKEQKIQIQLEKASTKLKKQQDKEIAQNQEKKKKAEKAKNGATKKNEKKKEETPKKSAKGKNRNSKNSDQETEDIQEESENSSLQGDSSEIEQSNQSDVEQDSEEVTSDVENSSQQESSGQEEEEEDENENDQEQSSKSQIIEDEDEVDQTDSSVIEQEESENAVTDDSNEEEQQQSQEEESEDEEEENQEENEQESQEEEQDSQDQESGDKDVEEEENDEDQTEDADDEESENEEVESIIQSDESTIEENQRNKQKTSKQKPTKNGKVAQTKAQQKSKSKEKDQKKIKQVSTKKKEHIKAEKDKKSNKKDPKSKKSKRGLSSLFSKEIKNLMRNQDPSILQLSSKREKALRSATNPIETNQHNHNNITNGVNNKNKNNSNNTKQNISKFEQTPKKKQKI